MNPPHCIGILDDDAAMRRALRRLLEAEGYRVHCWASAAELLEDPDLETADCLLLDVSMPGIGGLDLQDQLAARGIRLPVVFLTGKGDIPMTVRAMKTGAVDFLTKPVADEVLFAAIRAALEIAARGKPARERLATLTPREREVFTHVIAGKLNKQIAAVLGTSEQTIKVHRMRITEKLGEPSVAGLVRLADSLGIPPACGH
jgi:FixJ family two-component response regulator